MTRLHATHDSTELTAAGRRAFLSRFEREVDPEGVLDPAERSRRAEHLRRSYFSKLGFASSMARSARAAEQRKPRAKQP